MLGCVPHRMRIEKMLQSVRCSCYSSSQETMQSSAKSIVDFADERIVSFEELEPEERTYCSMLSNLILGGALLIIGLIAGAV